MNVVKALAPNFPNRHCLAASSDAPEASGTGTFPCDDAGDGVMRGYCSQWALQRNEKVRNLLLDKISRHWGTAHKTGFARLRKCAEEFADARGWMETDLTGFAQAMLSIQTQEDAKNQLLNDLERFELGEFPAFTPEHSSALEQQLMQTYQQLMQAMEQQKDGASAFGTVRKADVQDTQEKWLQYRDALAALGQARYPSVAAHSWRAMLTERRIRQLEALLGGARTPGIV